MAQASRETIYQALFNVVSSAYPWVTTSRRLKLWGDVQLDDRPAFFQHQGKGDGYRYSSQTIFGSQVRTLHAWLFFYTNAKDPTIIGASQLNAISDALDAALNPSGADLATGLQTLGGLVNDCRIINVPVEDCGDLDGDGLLIVEVEMTLP